MSVTSLDISVIICAYTEERWDELLAAVASVLQQTLPPREVIVVIDHHPILFERARAHLSGARVIANQEAQGLSGARNSGIALAQGAVVAFMDEDAEAAPDWLAQLREGYADPQVLGVGGTIEPRWVAGQPDWFPEEFHWVVGCTYQGMPEHRRTQNQAWEACFAVRNLIGCNMSFRRELFEMVGGFRDGVGQVGKSMLRCDDTEFCIRAQQAMSEGIFLHNPKAKVYHHVPEARGEWRYFRRRCYTEGLAKAQISQLVGSHDGLSSEWTYTLRTLPQGVARGLLESIRERQPRGLARAGAIMAGLMLTTAGYLKGRLSRSSPRSTSKNLAFEPAKLLEVELSAPLPDISAWDEEREQPYQRLRMLVRLHHQPLGFVELRLKGDQWRAETYVHKIWQALHEEINAHLRQDGLPEITQLAVEGLPAAHPLPCEQQRHALLAHAPFVSVVIATRDRAERLTSCLESLLALDYPNYEIIVVDNAPTTNETADLMRKTYGNVSQIRYVLEERPGLAVAHNRGLMEVDAPIVAFTDDDVVVDKHWLTAIVQGFEAGEEVGCVTGMILPIELQTPAQLWIEQFGGFSKGFKQQIFALQGRHRPPNRLYPYTAGKFGSGANMAFKSTALQAIGGFDPALGAGSLALAGDDLAAFFQVIMAGYQLVYQPAAIVHHAHRRDYAGLRRQAYGYGVGLTAYLMKTWVDKPTRVLDLALRAPSGVLYALSPYSEKNSKKEADYPSELARLEYQGMLYGPLAYLRSRWHVTISGEM